MAAFHLIIYGRFWVITEAESNATRVIESQVGPEGVPFAHPWLMTVSARSVSSGAGLNGRYCFLEFMLSALNQPVGV